MRMRFFKVVLLWILGLALLGLVIMLLWNFVMPAIFGLASISYLQALALFVIARILFGRLGFSRHGMFHHGASNPIHQKWMKMSPEERKEFINKRRKFGFGHSHPFSSGDFDMDEHEEYEKKNG